MYLSADDGNSYLAFDFSLSVSLALSMPPIPSPIFRSVKMQSLNSGIQQQNYILAS